MKLRDLPNSFLELLKLSNGGSLENDEREIGVFGDQSLREYLLEYQFPDHMPGCLPFGLNGGGVFYIFDMREPATDGEFPILVASSGALDLDDALVVANNINELMEDPRNVEDLLWPED